MSQHYLNPLFKPRSIAVFGASERAGSVGSIVFENLRSGGFQGKLFPINPKHDTVQGVPAYPGLDVIAGPIDLAVIVTPAPTVPAIIEACGQRGVKAAIIISAGFGETGEAGAALEQKAKEMARRYGLRFIGPNCLGLMRPDIGLNATFNKGNAAAGRLALVSQSGALCTAILDWARVSGVGFSNVVSVGSSADVDFGGILDFLVNDPETDSILLYIEGIRETRSFMSALRAAARTKPVVAIKVGRHAAGSRAARSHTGALVGSDDVFDAALKRAGVVRVQTVVQLFAVAQALSSHYRPEGDRLAIITNGGGPGALAADRTGDLGVPLAQLEPATLEALNQVLPLVWSHGNPVDIIGDAPPERYEQAAELCLRDANVDGVLAILTPQAMTEPTEAARRLVAVSQRHRKPLIVSWMGEEQVAEGRRLFVDAHIPSYRSPEPAVDTFYFLSAYYQNQKLLMQVPQPLAHQVEPDVEGARLIIENALAERRSVLSEVESKALLSAFHIPVAQTVVARSPNEALLAAEQMGFPVAMKINSPDITHKSDVGGVRLGLDSAQAVRAAFHDMMATVASVAPDARIDGVAIERMLHNPNARELMVGVVADQTFGPVIAFGAGGTAVEVLQDRAVSLPPLNRYLVNNMIDGTRVARMLGTFRNMPPANMDALEAVLLRVSEMVCELPWLREMDINPLLLDEHGACAVDARVVVAPVAPSMDRYAHMAICPYPAHLVTHWQLGDGTEITLRPIRPEDAGIEQDFVRGLSDASRYSRFMDMQRELSPMMLARFTQIDYDREMALIATVGSPDAETQVGVARYIINPDGHSCEFAIVIADAWQQRGIAHKLLGILIDTARQRGLISMEGEVLAANTGMLRLVKAQGFQVRAHAEDTNLKQVVKILNV